MDGGDRAGYKQISKSIDSVYITTTMAACSATQQWVSIEVISSAARIESITAAGLKNASNIDSAVSFPTNSIIACGKITAIKLATCLPAGKVVAHERVLI